jgi:cardiolipin synthase
MAAARSIILVLLLATLGRAQVITTAPDPNHALLSAATQTWADGLAGAPLTGGNRFALLENGVRSFPEKLALIAAARQDVFFSTMIFGWDQTGRQLVDALGAAAARGVRVRCLLDGQRTHPRVYLALRQRGVKVALFNPFVVPDGRKHRLHQKLVVADLRTMICGGMNATDAYHLADGVNDYYKDTDVWVAGDAAASASVVFLRQWLEVKPKDAEAQALLASATTWGPLPVAGGPTARTGCARWLVQESDLGSSVIRDYYERCFQEARLQVLWHVNNVLPTPELTQALAGAASRGARCAIVTNSLRANIRRNGAFAGWLQFQFTRLQLRRLRGTGVEVWELDVPLHSKALTVDGVLASVGSYNFSSSSEKNLEATVVSYDPALIGEVEAMFDRDLRAARRVQP